MKFSLSWIKDVGKIKAFENKPNHALFALLVFVFILGGGLMTIFAKEPAYAFGAFALVLVTFLIFVKQPDKRVPPLDKKSPIAPISRDPLYSLRTILHEEVRQIHGMVDSPWLKEKLLVVLEVQSIGGNSASAKIIHRGEFYVQNSGEETVDFQFFSQIDISRQSKQKVKGILRITDLITGVEQKPYEYSYEPKGDPRGLEHYHKQIFRLPSHCKHAYRWETGPRNFFSVKCFSI